MTLRPDWSLPVPIKPVIDEMNRRANNVCLCSGRGKPYFMDTELAYEAGCDECKTRVYESKEELQRRLI